MFKRVSRAFNSTRVRISAAWVFSTAVYFLLLAWHLGTSPAGLTAAEQSSRFNSNLTEILKHPVNAPYRILQDGLIHINNSSAFLIRLESLVIALILLAGFYYSLRGWFGKHIAYLSAVLLAFTPYFILAARSATPDIMYFSPAILIACYLLAKNHPDNRWLLLLAGLATVFSLYVPGIIWLIIPVAVYKFGRIKEMLGEAELSKLQAISSVIILLLLLAPLVAGLVSHPSDIRQLLSIPDKLPGPLSALRDWGWGILSLFIQARSHHALMIERLPFMDVAQIGLLVFGGFVMWSRVRSEFLLILGLALLVTLLSGLSDNYGLLAEIVVLFSLVVGMGLRYLFIEWRGVFPINPLAKFFAIFLMSVLVAAHVLYGGRYGLLAWPVTVAGKSSSVLK